MQPQLPRDTMQTPRDTTQTPRDTTQTDRDNKKSALTEESIFWAVNFQLGVAEKILEVLAESFKFQSRGNQLGTIFPFWKRDDHTVWVEQI